MKRVVKGIALSLVLILTVLCLPGPTQAFVPQGWQKLTGKTAGYSGVPDGISAVRENSYAWSMDFLGGYLYVGTARNVFGSVLGVMNVPVKSWPASVPIPTDMRSRIFRMKLSTGKWECVYVSDAIAPTQKGQPVTGLDMGYRMMKTFRDKETKSPVLYIGSAGYGYCRTLAIDSKFHAPKEVFHIASPGFISVRAITEYNDQIVWASEERGYPTIWRSSNPLAECTKNSSVQYKKIPVPTKWFPKGGEVFDMISYKGWLYVFFVPHDAKNLGFWCARARKAEDGWKWVLIAGDRKLGAKYPAGMGRPYNAGATPIIFKDMVYVGTLNALAFKLLNGYPIDPKTIADEMTGSQIWRFGGDDKWERVMPPSIIADTNMELQINGFLNGLNLYVWRFGIQDGKLYAGTFDARTIVEAIAPLYKYKLPYLWDPAGFDIYCTMDGVIWWPETLDGFSDGWNYGARTFATDPSTKDLYLGTANPFFGCQVWRLPHR